MSASILDTIIGLTFPILFIGSFFWIIPFLQRKIFKELLQSFKTDEAVPSSTVRVRHLAYGKNVRYNNAVKIAEDHNSLFIKIPFISNMKIPLGNIAHVSLKDGLFKSRIFTIQFKNNHLSPLSLTLKPNQLSAFPQLKRLSDRTEMQGQKMQERQEYQEVQDVTNASFSLPKEVFTDGQPYNMQELQSKAGNWVRGIILIGLVIFGIFAYFAYGQVL